RSPARRLTASRSRWSQGRISSCEPPVPIFDPVRQAAAPTIPRRRLRTQYGLRSVHASRVVKFHPNEPHGKGCNPAATVGGKPAAGGMTVGCQTTFFQNRGSDSVPKTAQDAMPYGLADLRLEHLDQGLADSCRRRRHPDAGGFHGGNL